MEREKTPRHDEGAFIARLKAGDADAYEELVKLHSRRLIALARQILGDEDLARDAVQDAFINAFRAIDRFNGDARLSSWLHRIVVNAALAKLRVKRRRPESFYTDEFGFGADEVYRAVVFRPSDGQHHMVTFWFEDADDPWVIDPTGAMTSGMPRMSQVPEWSPLKVFSEDDDFSVHSEIVARHGP